MSSENATNAAPVHGIVIPVFWMMEGDGTIHQSNAIEVDGKRVVFDDGGWNPIDSCFFSEAQCRKYHNLPPKDWADARDIVCDKLEALVDELRG